MPGLRARPAMTDFRFDITLAGGLGAGSRTKCPARLQRSIWAVCRTKCPDVADVRPKSRVLVKTSFPGNGLVVDPAMGIRPGLRRHRRKTFVCWETSRPLYK